MTTKNTHDGILAVKDDDSLVERQTFDPFFVGKMSEAGLRQALKAFERATNARLLELEKRIKTVAKSGV